MARSQSQRTHLKAEEVADWLTPKDAADILDQVYNDRFLAKKTLLGRLLGGMVEAASDHSLINDAGRKLSANFILIPDVEWKGIEPTDSFWKTGDLTYMRRSEVSSHQEMTVSHFGVRFEPRGVRDIIRNAAPPLAKAPPAKIRPGSQAAPEITRNKGGAPRKEWWDDFWIATCGKIYEGDFKPKSQADLERAMLDWASTNGHDMSESSAKTAARKLFKAWKLGDKN